jgi:hypothetical protein
MEVISALDSMVGDDTHKDRNGIEYALAPTHEEAFTNVIVW